MDLAAQTKVKNGKKTDGGKGAREAYYDKISKLDMAPLWVVLKDIIPDEPKTVCAPAIWKFKDVKPLVAEAGDRDLRRGGDAPRAGAGESEAARPVAHHAIALCRPPAHPAGRDRPAAPPQPGGDPLHPRRRGRLHPGRRREDQHGARRLRAHPVRHHPRPRQRIEEVDDLARRARRADGEFLRDLLL